ncbi:MAG: hypothetical protein V1820_06145 [archaeon]
MSQAKYALKLAYFGGEFFGSQIQPKVPTVAGALAQALRKGGFFTAPEEGKLLFASRTDRGVSALSNVAVYSGKKPILGKLNHLLPESVCVWGFAEVPEDFTPRHSERKTYLYFLPDSGEDFSLLSRAVAQFAAGERDFSAFSKKDSVEKNARFALESAEVKRIPGFFLFSFTARNFLWNQVRRMVGGAQEAAKGAINLSLLEALLLGKAGAGAVRGIPTAPAEGLVLYNIEYADLKFSEEKPVSLTERFRQPALAAAQTSKALSVLALKEPL